MIKSIKKDKSGFSLIEVIVGLLLFVIIGVAFYGALTTALRTVILTQERTTAESLARSEMENIIDGPYLETYPEVTFPKGYLAKPSIVYTYTENLTENVTAYFQEIMVEIYHDDKQVITLTDFKTK